MEAMKSAFFNWFGNPQQVLHFLASHNYKEKSSSFLLAQLSSSNSKTENKL